METSCCYEHVGGWSSGKWLSEVRRALKRRNLSRAMLDPFYGWVEWRSRPWDVEFVHAPRAPVDLPARGRGNLVVGQQTPENEEIGDIGLGSGEIRLNVLISLKASVLLVGSHVCYLRGVRAAGEKVGGMAFIGPRA
ncbi:MAG: hypothetical protein ACHQ7N_18155 [Candidatus Methylomirabilales bacterium]